MVSRERMAEIARRYDTVMSRAMLRALGVAPSRHGGHRQGRGNAYKRLDARRYRAMKWCFENHDSPCR